MKRIFAAILCICLLCMPVYAKSEEKLVALTFDDGPSGRFTRKLLEGLAERNTKATFFLCGYRIEQYPELTEVIFSEGHEIGLHGYSHKSMQDMPANEILYELKKCTNLLPKGCNVTFLRCPGGLCSQQTRTAAGSYGLSLAYWSVDPRDWDTDDAAAIEKHITENVKNGDIILLHDMSDSSVEAALRIVDKLSKDGYRFVTLSQLAAANGIRPAPGVIYSNF